MLVKDNKLFEEKKIIDKNKNEFKCEMKKIQEEKKEMDEEILEPIEVEPCHLRSKKTLSRYMPFFATYVLKIHRI